MKKLSFSIIFAFTVTFSTGCTKKQSKAFSVNSDEASALEASETEKMKSVVDERLKDHPVLSSQLKLVLGTQVLARPLRDRLSMPSEKTSKLLIYPLRIV
jgi:hypothetical protein